MASTNDLTKLPAKKLHALIAKREAEARAACDACITNGLGQARHTDLVEMAKGSSLLNRTLIARSYVSTSDAAHEARGELDARRKYHGGDKPIKRAEC